MRHKTHDKTLYRNSVRKGTVLIQEYELVKQKRHPTFRVVADCYRFHQTHRQTCLKSGQEQALVPQKRGPQWKSRRVYGSSEHQVLLTGGRASVAMRFANSWPPHSSTGPPRRAPCLG